MPLFQTIPLTGRVLATMSPRFGTGPPSDTQDKPRLIFEAGAAPAYNQAISNYSAATPRSKLSLLGAQERDAANRSRQRRYFYSYPQVRRNNAQSHYRMGVSCVSDLFPNRSVPLVLRPPERVVAKQTRAYACLQGTYALRAAHATPTIGYIYHYAAKPGR